MAFILSVGHAPELLRTRTLLLRSAGYSVREESDVWQALQTALDDHIDLVLLCHSLNKTEIEFLVMTLAEKRQLLPVLCVRRDDFSIPLEECLPMPNAPDLLLHQVETLLPPRSPGDNGYGRKTA
jgi:CheY-like chemotaxis protein